MLKKCEEYLQKYLLEKADISIYTLEFNELKKKIMMKSSEIGKGLVLIFSKIIKERSQDIREWLAKSIDELSEVIVRIEQFLVKKSNMDRIQS